MSKIKTPVPIEKLGAYTLRYLNKGPGHIAAMYGTGPQCFVQFADAAHKVIGVDNLDFDSLVWHSIEARVLGRYAGYDPRNHIGRNL